jgi:zinc protease
VLLSVYGETVGENLPEVLGLIKEILHEASFPQEELDKMILENITGIESQMSDPIALASNRMSRHTNPYDKDDPRYEPTFEESIAAHRAMKIEDIRNFHKTYYGANHGTVAVIGDFDEEMVLEALTDMLGNWNTQAEYARLEGRPGNKPVINEAIETPDKPNAFFLANQQFEMNDSHEDYPALVLGNFMLGGGFLNSRLAVRIRQKEGLSYGVGSFLGPGAIDKVGTFQTYAIYAPENLEPLEEAFKEEIIKVLEEGFTEEELAAAKSGWLQNRSVSRSQDNYLAGTLNGNLFLKRTILWEQELEEKVSALTPQQIQEAMKRHLDLNKMSIVKAGEFSK